MSSNVKKVTVFISSPNELAKERKICKKVINEMSKIIGKHFQIEFYPWLWEDERKAVGSGNPQSRTADPAKADIYLGMFWKSFGSPTGILDDDNNEYESGTYQEFDTACKANKKNKGKPEIWFFKKSCKSDIDPKVTDFFKQFSKGGKHEGIYGKFENSEELAQILREKLFDYAMEIDESVSLHGLYKKDGIEEFYLKGDNNKRNASKKNTLKDIKYIRLLARTGNSYLNDQADRFYAPLCECLDNGAKAEIILANPYSEMGFYLTMGDANPRYSKPILERTRKFMEDYLAEFRAEEAIRAIEESEWYSQQKKVLSEYKKLKKEFKDNIVLRMSKYEINCSLLITEKTTFFDPYFHYGSSTRGMNAFEVQINNEIFSKEIENSYAQYFSFMWDLSEEYEDYEKNIENYKNALKNTLENGLLKNLK